MLSAEAAAAIQSFAVMRPCFDVTGYRRRLNSNFPIGALPAWMM